jgi:hypothetical protein
MENNFGYINSLFFQNVPNLLKTKDGKKIVKEYANIVKSNKELIKEYEIYEFLENLGKVDNLQETISEVLSTYKLNKKTLKEGHNKLIKLLTENNIVCLNPIENNNNTLYENIDKFIMLPKTVKTISEQIEIKKVICEEVSKKTPFKETLIKETVEINDASVSFLVERFNKKYTELFDNDSKELFNKINSSEKEQMFEEQRKECLSLTNTFLESAIDNNTKGMLLSVKEKLLEDKFNQETYVEDIINYIELKETLSE